MASPAKKKSPVGYLCTVTSKEHLGQVRIRYYGKTKFKDGVWAGLELNTPDGKNDGSVGGTRYFTCEPNFGMFVPSSTIQIIPKSGPKVTKPSSKLSETEKPSSAASTPKKTRPKDPSTPVKTPKAKPQTTEATTEAKTTTGPSTPTVSEEESREAKLQAKKEAEKKRKENAEAEKRKEELAAYMSVKAFEAEIEQLKEDCEDLRTWKTTAQGKLKDLQKELTTTTAEANKKEEASQTRVKELEKEISRIAGQYQKENEKKEKTWVVEKKALEEEIDELKDEIEGITLDKDLAEESRMEMEAEVDTLRGKLEILEAQESSRNISTGGEQDANTNEILESLKTENEKLKVAIMKLRDLSLVEKQQATKRIKELEKENSALPGLEEKVLLFETQLLETEENFEDIKEQLDVALEAEDMVQELNDKNMDLAQKIEEFQMNIEELEELRDLSEEIEEQQTEEIKNLRKQIHLAEIKSLDQETTFKNLHQKFADQQKVILKFREKTQELKEKLLEYVEADQEKSIETINLENKLQRLMDENLQFSNKVQKMDAAQMENELYQLDVELTKSRMDSLCAFVPSEVFEEDMEVIDTNLMVLRLSRKCNLALNHLKTQFNLHDYIISPNTTPKDTEERFFGFRLIRQIVSISTVLQEIHSYITKSTDSQKWLSYVNLQWDIKAQEHSIDLLLSAIKSREINETYSLENILKAERILKALAQQHQMIPERNFALEALRNFVYDSQELVLEHQRIQRCVTMALSLDRDTNTISEAEEICKGEEIKERLKLLLAPCRKALKLIQSDFFHDIHDYDVSIVNSVIPLSASCSELLNIFQKLRENLAARVSDFDSDSKSVDDMKEVLSDVLKSFVNATDDQISVVNEESENLVVPPSDVSVDDSNVWKHIETKLTTLTRGLETYTVALQELTARYESEQETTRDSTADPISSAFQQRSSMFFEEFKSLSTLKQKLQESLKDLKEHEASVLSLEKSVANGTQIQQMLEGKVQKLNEKQSELVSLLEKEKEETKRQSKSWEDALVAMQEDIDLLEREKSDLSERLALQKKYGTLSQNEEESNLRVPLSAVNKELGALRSAIGYLQQENSLLRSHGSTKLLEQLSPLSLSHASNDSDRLSETLHAYRTELQSLLSRIQRLQSAPVVVSLPLSPEIVNQRAERISELKILRCKVDDLQDRIQHLVSKLPETSKKANFASFPGTSLVQQSSQGKLCGKISLPISQTICDILPNYPKEQKICLSAPAMQQIHSVVLLGAH